MDERENIPADEMKFSQEYYVHFKKIS